MCIWGKYQAGPQAKKVYNYSGIRTSGDSKLHDNNTYLNDTLRIQNAL